MKFVLIGSVNHGKSTLAGRLLVGSKTIDGQVIDKIKKKSDEFKLSHLLDTDDNERMRCKTYSMNKAQFEYQGKKYEIIDVPGHKELVSEMILGTSLADIAILVISIRSKEYNSGLLGQSIEHALLAKAMGIDSLVIAINKIDTIDWNKSIYDKLVADFSKRIKKYRFKHVKFVPISALLGENIFERYGNQLVNYSLIEAINTIPIISRKTTLIQPNDNMIQGRFLFYDIPNIITSGFICKLRSNTQLYDAEIVSIKNGPYAFVSSNNSKGTMVHVILTLSTNKDISTNAILRNANRTIAIGQLF